MTTKTYYGKLDCLSSNSSAEMVVNEYCKSFVDFMSYLTASNVASLVAWNSGSGAVSGSFNTRGYWDQTNAHGIGAHQVWKFPSSSARPFDWYLYTQFVTGSSAINAAFNLPISGYTSTTDIFSGGTTSRGIIMQAVVCFSGTTSFSPWNGSGVSDGQDTTGNPRWLPGGANRNMYVLPRSNDANGAAVSVVQKSNAIALGGISTTSTTKLRYHFIFDGDALLVLTNDTTSTAGFYNISYVGPFELRANLSGSGIGSGSQGFVMNTCTAGTPQANTFVLATSFGDTAGTTTTTNGGIAAPIGGTTSGLPGSGSKIAILNSFNSILMTPTMGPNFYTNQFDEFPIYVGGNETSFQGLLGTLNSGLVSAVNGPQVHDIAGDGTRAIFGGTTTIALSNTKVSVPWTGSLAPGIGTSRTGSNFTWTIDYG